MSVETLYAEAEWGDGAAEPACGISLAMRIHDRVLPRLCGVALALGAEDGLGPRVQRRCHDELAAALLELRALLRGSISDAGPSLAAELERWRAAGAPLRVSRADGARVPTELEGLVCEVVGEAVRNALRHACPSEVVVGVENAAGCLVLSVANDGVAGGSDVAGLRLGLRLAAAVAAEREGHLEWGPVGESRWLVRLTVPIPAS
jgi:signal transduction histidine kinase